MHDSYSTDMSIVQRLSFTNNFNHFFEQSQQGSVQIVESDHPLTDNIVSSSKPTILNNEKVSSGKLYPITPTPPFDKFRPTYLGHVCMSEAIAVSQPAEYWSMIISFVPHFEEIRPITAGSFPQYSGFLDCFHADVCA